ncbi:glycosyltransferase family 4 protein [uncultured Polaribacter sp.]|uniref:MraY family glycosyltransferase n=1 Tax=uncultured Polaribacter sp. TaxID=174711 RepID=UPI00260C436D|nr:glycosyltransferase family 4 protein [uncultured Polaribacter sp.]
MLKYFVIFAVLAIISYLYLKLAIKFKIIDKPNQRSSHTKSTIRGGGILFTIAIILFFFFNNFEYPYFFIGVLSIAIVSFLDDIYTLSSKVRFPFQILAIALIMYQINIPFFPIYLFVLYFVMGVGIINMFNFMDGINGITGLYSLATISGFYFINVNEQIINSEIVIYTVLSIIIFGFYNFRKKALFFAGDIGSISIGMLIFFVGLYFTVKLNSPLILLLVIVYGADAGNTLLYRKFYTKESVLEPHRHHIYQKLVDKKKVPHLQVSLIYTLLQLIVNFIVYKTYRLELTIQIYVFLVLVAVFMFLYIYGFKKLRA